MSSVWQTPRILMESLELHGAVPIFFKQGEENNLLIKQVMGGLGEGAAVSLILIC